MSDDVGVAEVEAWAGQFSQVEALLWPRFGRREPRARAVGYVRSLMAPLERKNGWTISEATGARSPDSVQWLLTGADWDPDLLRDDLRERDELGGLRGRALLRGRGRRALFDVAAAARGAAAVGGHVRGRRGDGGASAGVARRERTLVGGGAALLLARHAAALECAGG